MRNVGLQLVFRQSFCFRSCFTLNLSPLLNTQRQTMKLLRSVALCALLVATVVVAQDNDQPATIALTWCPELNRFTVHGYWAPQDAEDHVISLSKEQNRTIRQLQPNCRTVDARKRQLGRPVTPLWSYEANKHGVKCVDGNSYLRGLQMAADIANDENSECRQLRQTFDRRPVTEGDYTLAVPQWARSIGLNDLPECRIKVSYRCDVPNDLPPPPIPPAPSVLEADGQPATIALTWCPAMNRFTVHGYWAPQDAEDHAISLNDNQRGIVRQLQPNCRTVDERKRQLNRPVSPLWSYELRTHGIDCLDAGSYLVGLQMAADIANDENSVCQRLLQTFDGRSVTEGDYTLAVPQWARSIGLNDLPECRIKVSYRCDVPQRNAAPDEATFSAMPGLSAMVSSTAPPEDGGPSPRVDSLTAVDWLAVYKFDAKFATTAPPDHCVFDTSERIAADYKGKQCQHYAMSTNSNPKLTAMPFGSLIGTSTDDPLGATFDQFFNGPEDNSYVIYNDQFYGDPSPTSACSEAKGCGHAKGAVMWDAKGDGILLQVTTPNWPRNADASEPTTVPGNGNTLGCITQKKDGSAKPQNNIYHGQHFFSVKLREGDAAKVLTALRVAQVFTNSKKSQIYRTLYKTAVQKKLKGLADAIKPNDPQSVPEMYVEKGYRETLSTGVVVLAKPSQLTVPPWHFVSAHLGGISLDVATWYEKAKMIKNTNASDATDCQADDSCCARPLFSSIGPFGSVTNYLCGTFEGKKVDLRAGTGASVAGNHAKIGVSTSEDAPWVVFSDMNQAGCWNKNDAGCSQCAKSQSRRGGTFYAVSDLELWRSWRSLIAGNAQGAADWECAKTQIPEVADSDDE